MRSLKRAEMLPDVPWLRPLAFIQRHLAMIALRSSISSFFMASSKRKRLSHLAAHCGNPASPLLRTDSAAPDVSAATLRRPGAGGCALVLVAEDDAPLVEIVGAHLDRHAVAFDGLDAVLLHLAGRV